MPTACWDTPKDGPCCRGTEGGAFFNLPAGNYVFEVKAANNDGLWGDEVSALGFRVHPSPFLSRWAYLVYAALLSAVAYFIWRYFTNKKIFEQRLELERIKEQNMKQLTQARINFFTNISHDLKTPLTLVVDPLKQLKEHLPANAPGNAYVHLIEKNVGRIQRMISQLLQFREIESQKITLNRQPGDLIRFIDSIFSLFEFYANKKGIETGFNSQYESFYTKFDHDVIEKIFTNLFSNAIKYASENGYVGVRIYPARQDQRPESAPPPPAPNTSPSRSPTPGRKSPTTRRRPSSNRSTTSPTAVPNSRAAAAWDWPSSRSWSATSTEPSPSVRATRKSRSRWSCPSRSTPKRPTAPPNRTNTRSPKSTTC